MSKCQNNILLTVIVPNYNMVKTLGICLDSILNQTLKNLQIIVIDDCSTDNSLTLLSIYEKKNKNLKVVKFDKNHELGYSRQYALNLVKTPYVTFIDADDWVDTYSYEKCIKKMHNDNSEIAIYGMKNEYKNKFSSNIRYEYVDHCISGEFALNLLCNTYTQDIGITPIVNNKVYQTSFLKANNINFSELPYYEDVVFSFLAIKHAKKISLIGGCFYHYFQNPDSKLHIINHSQINHFCYAFKEIYTNHINIVNDRDFKIFFSYLDKSVTSLIMRINSFPINDSEKKEFILALIEGISEFIDIKKILEYIDMDRLLRVFKLTE